MSKRIMLGILISFLLLVSACNLRDEALAPPSESEGEEVPLYTEASRLEVQDSDTRNFIRDVLGPEYLRYEYSTDFSWTRDTGLKVRDQLDQLLPDRNWRLEEDWHEYGQLSSSHWRNGDLHVLAVIFDNLDSNQVNDFRRRYGISDLEAGATVIITHLWDVTHPRPTPTLNPEALSTMVDVDATKQWQSTGILVEEGTELTISVTDGQWTHWEGSIPYNDGDGTTYVCAEVFAYSQCVEPIPDYPTGALIGRIGTQAFGVGSSSTLVAHQSGDLLLGINDGNNGLHDNEGVLTVEVILH